MTLTAFQFIKASGTRISCDTNDASVPENFLEERYINSTSNQGIAYRQLLAEGLDNHPLILEAAKSFKDSKLPENEKIYQVVYRIYALLGKRMLQHISGSALTQTNPSTAYDMQAVVKNAEDIISSYEAIGISRDRVIIKVPATWEGLQACKILKEKKIRTLGTVVYSKTQAILAAQVGCVAISQYINDIEEKVNRDLYKKPENILDHRGIQLNWDIQKYYWRHGVTTQNVPACFILPEELLALAGCDEVTLAPDMLDTLNEMTDFNPNQYLKREKITESFSDVKELSEEDFKYQIKVDQYAARNISFALKFFEEAEIKLNEAAKTALAKV